MRNLWTIASVLAIANVFAIGSFVGWLGASGRLDRERFFELKGVLAEKPEEREARLAAGVAEGEQRDAEVQQLRDQVARLMTSPMTAEELVALQQEAAMAADHRMTRTMRELDDLRDLLARERRESDRLAEAIEMQRAAFEARITERDKLIGQEQFRTAVESLQGQRAPVAMAMLMALWEGQAAPLVGGLDGEAVAVEYLRAMEGRQRNKVIAEFAGADPTLAAVLLERLRTDGVTPEVADAATAPNEPDTP